MSFTWVQEGAGGTLISCCFASHVATSTVIVLRDPVLSEHQTPFPLKNKRQPHSLTHSLSSMFPKPNTQTHTHSLTHSPTHPTGRKREELNNLRAERMNQSRTYLLTNNTLPPCTDRKILSPLRKHLALFLLRPVPQSCRWRSHNSVRLSFNLSSQFEFEIDETYSEFGFGALDTRGNEPPDKSTAVKICSVLGMISKQASNHKCLISKTKPMQTLTAQQQHYAQINSCQYSKYHRFW